MDRQEPLPIADNVANDSSSPKTNTQIITNQSPGRVLTHLAVISAIVLPIACIPYLISKRNTNVLRRQIFDHADTVSKLQRDLKTTMLENALRRDEHTRVRGSLAEMQRQLQKVSTDVREECADLDAGMKRALSSFREQGEQQMLTQDTSDAEFRSALQIALDEARDTR